MTLLLDRRHLLTATATLPLATLPLGGIGGRAWAQAAVAAPPYTPPRIGRPLADAVAAGFGVYDPAPLFYVAEDRLMRGMAATYAPIHEGDYTVPAAPPGAAPDPQGGALGGVGAGPPADMPGLPRFDAMDMSPRRVLGMAPYTTRLLIYRPRDMRRFSGTVLIEMMHPAGGGSTPMWSVLNRFMARRGDVYVGVQHPRTLPWLKYHWPDRYGALSCDDYTQLWGMITDTAHMLKDGGAASPIGAKARRAYLTGYSFTGLIATSVAKQHHAVNRMPDGKPLFDGYPIGTGFGPMPPLDVPVMIGANQYANYNDTNVLPPSSSPAMMTRALRAGFDADGPMTRRRRYEVPGFQHGPLPATEPGGAVPPSAGVDNAACYYQWQSGAVANANPFAFQLYEAMLRNMYDWVERDIAPPRAPLIETARGKPVPDDYGNSRGGLRLPDIVAPAATYYTGVGECTLRGWKVPFRPARMKEIYGDWNSYLRRYAQATDQCVAARFILSERGAEMKAAMARAMPTF